MKITDLLGADEMTDLMVHYAVLRATVETIANSPEMDAHVALAQKALQKINEA